MENTGLKALIKKPKASNKEGEGIISQEEDQGKSKNEKKNEDNQRKKKEDGRNEDDVDCLELESLEKKS